MSNKFNRLQHFYLCASKLFYSLLKSNGGSLIKLNSTKGAYGRYKVFLES